MMMMMMTIWIAAISIAILLLTTKIVGLGFLPTSSTETKPLENLKSLWAADGRWLDRITPPQTKFLFCVTVFEMYIAMVCPACACIRHKYTIFYMRKKYNVCVSNPSNDIVFETCTSSAASVESRGTQETMSAYWVDMWCWHETSMDQYHQHISFEVATWKTSDLRWDFQPQNQHAQNAHP